MNGTNQSISDWNWSRDLLKLVAITAMTADQVSTYLMEHGTIAYEICQFFGNFTIVIMSYFIVQGLKYTHSVRRYAIRMLIWAVISEAPFYLLFGLQLNVLFTLLASLIIIYLTDRKGWLAGIAALALFFPLSLICDWSIIAPVFTVIYYVLQKKEKLSSILIPVSYSILTPVSYFILRMILYTETQAEYVIGTLSIFLASLLVFAFRRIVEENGRGKIPGLVFYAYYPLHLVTISIILSLL